MALLTEKASWRDFERKNGSDGLIKENKTVEKVLFLIAPGVLDPTNGHI